MPETSFSFSYLESPEAGSTIPAGAHALRGWVMPRNGTPFVDVRARIGTRIFAGVHGFPRPDLSAHFQTRRPALAEFYVVVEVEAGTADVSLEALSIDGGWRAFQRVSLSVIPANPAATVATPRSVIRWHEFGRTLRLLLQAQHRDPAAPVDDLARDLIADIPYPRDLRHPHPPFRGYLDEPAAITRCGFGRAAVLGYLFHEHESIARVLATFDLQLWQPIEHRRPSPGPATTYPQFPTAATAGLFGIIDVPAQLPEPVSLRLYAELADGSLHLCAVQRSALYTQEEEKALLARRTPDAVGRAATALRTAMQARAMEVVNDGEMTAEIARVEEEIGTAAWVPEGNPAPLRPAPVRRDAPLPARILLVTHNLNWEGAPLFLLDLARHHAGAGATLTVLTPADGPLRTRFEEIGASVRVIDANPVFQAESATAARAAMASFGQALEFAGCDLVIANTFTTFWAVHAAHAAGRRVLLYVHESTTPASFYRGRVRPDVVALADEAFALADGVSFTTEATRRYHLGYGRNERHWLAPGWIDVARLDAWRAQHPRADERARFNLGADELFVANVGTVCDRKGQNIFARAVDLLWARDPALAARTRFVMVGGGQTPFDLALTELLQEINRPNLVVHPATADYLPYYAAADLFVCSSYEESSPRVILEAMACHAPILSSGVQGVLEQVRDGIEATLVSPGDSSALADAMIRVLRAPVYARTLATRARARVAAQFSASELLPRHEALAAAVAALS